ncbi:glycosyltransferase family 1 protein [Methylocystis iwaonis]|uniref:glycosyltransferase family 4 protein n=1 Tax=Methylocystis iwaonis TaxID=2885079 RepID=UPI002E7BD393|nr:glycosyltransferase family 1 protein [Methylocystis iwaonis]
MRILVATDAWRPQVNGVVRSLESIAQAAEPLGAEIDFLTPRDFNSFPMPTYREISLALATPRAVRRRLAQGYDHIHIATEGPIGLAARAVCLRDKRVFTTSFHTRFPEYIHARTGLPVGLAYAALRRFHNAGAGVMVATPSLVRELDARGFRRLLRWSRGVDHSIFTPTAKIPLDFPRPIFLYAGRLAVEKNVEAFLALDLPGTKLIAGDGPDRAALEARFPDARFLGFKTPSELAALYASSDVFVFPSRTDTFGIVLLEALACGLPVAAYPVMGPLDVVGGSNVGVLDEDLRAASLAALEIPREAAYAYARAFTWENCAREFLDNIAYARGAASLGAVGLAALKKSGEQREAVDKGQTVQP